MNPAMPMKVPPTGPYVHLDQVIAPEDLQAAQRLLSSKFLPVSQPVNMVRVLGGEPVLRLGAFILGDAEADDLEALAEQQGATPGAVASELLHEALAKRRGNTKRPSRR